MVKTNYMKYLNLILLITLLGCEDDNYLINTIQNDALEDYTSKVPYYGPYPESLLEQKEILKNDLLLKRFGKSRKKQLEDPHHPIYHFTSPENKLNDPNGLSF